MTPLKYKGKIIGSSKIVGGDDSNPSNILASVELDKKLCPPEILDLVKSGKCFSASLEVGPGPVIEITREDGCGFSCCSDKREA